MTLVIVVWLALLTLYVALKARRPKWEYPKPPPLVEDPAVRDWREAMR